MAVILNSAKVDSAILVLSLKLTHTCQDYFPTFAQKTLLIRSDSTWWWQPSWHLPSSILPFCTKRTSLIHSDSTWRWQPSWILSSWIQPFCTKRTSLIHSDSTWWWQPSLILPCWIQTPCYLLSDLLKNTLPPLWPWLKLIQSDSNSFILTQLDDGSHLQFCYLRFSHFAPKETSLMHSDSNKWWQPSWTLPCWI